MTFQKALVVSAPTSFSALAFSDGLVEGIRMTADLGYDAVELAVRDPRLLDHAAVAHLARGLSLPVVALGTGQAYLEEGLSLTAAEEELRRGAAARLRAHIELAARLAAVEQPRVIVGLIRGKSGGKIDRAEAQHILADALHGLCGSAGALGVELVLEPVNRYESDLINTAKEAMALIEQVDCANLRLLLDTFHMNIEEANPEESLKGVAAAGRLGHLHLADSNRHAPGRGHIQFDALLRAAEASGYRGALSMEIMPLPDPRSAASLALEHLQKLGW